MSSSIISVLDGILRVTRKRRVAHNRADPLAVVGTCRASPVFTRVELPLRDAFPIHRPVVSSQQDLAPASQGNASFFEGRRALPSDNRESSHKWMRTVQRNKCGCKCGRTNSLGHDVCLKGGRRFRSMDPLCDEDTRTSRNAHAARARKLVTVHADPGAGTPLGLRGASASFCRVVQSRELVVFVQWAHEVPRMSTVARPHANFPAPTTLLVHLS